MLPQNSVGNTPAQILQGALDLASAGYRVFPIGANKAPSCKGGFYAATDDPDQIRAWSDSGQLKNIGVATGATPGLVVIDADNTEAADSMRERYGEPTALSAHSHTGGAHWYFAHPRNGKVSSNDGVQPGLDRKGDGGYVLAPPSTGKTWTDGIPDIDALPVLPEEFWGKEDQTEPLAGKTLDPEVFDAAANVIVEYYPPKGEQYEFGRHLAGYLMGNGLGEEDAYALMYEAKKRHSGLDKDTGYNIGRVTKTTAGRIARGENVTGGPNVEEYAPGLIQPLGRVLGFGWDGPGHMLRTDMGNAERFAKQHGSKIRWVPKFNQWASWDGQRWKLDEGGAAVRLAKETARNLFLEAAREPDDAKHKEIVAHAVMSQYANRLEAMIRLAKSDLEIEPAMLDANPWLLNVENGTLDLRTGELSEHDPADLITKLAPVEYHKDAEAPRFERFLQETLVKPTLIRYIQQFSGYTLTGSVRERVMSVLHGGGKNGKSTLTELFQDLLGDYSATVDVEVLLAQRYASGTASYSLAVLAGARYVSTAEVGENRQLAEARVKAITGGDKIDARAPYGKPFSYSPQFKLWLSTNDKPTIRGRDDAIWDRVKLTPFEQRFEGENADTTLPVKLRDELPGVLAWMVRGCLDWLENGLIEPDEVTAATQGYRDEMDTFAEFFDEECFVKEDAKVRAGVLWDAWVEYLRSTGEHNPGQKSKFNAQVEGRGGTRKRGKGGWMWHDVGLYGDWNRPEGSAAPDFDDGAPDVPQTPKKSKFSQDPPRIGKFEESGASGTSGTPEAEKIAPPPCPDRTHKSIAEPTPGEEPRRKKPCLEIQGWQAACKHPKAARRRGPDGGYTACGKCGALELPEVY